VFIILGALDECSDERPAEIVRQFHKIATDATEKDVRLMICLSCRESPAVTLPSKLTIELTKHNRSALDLYIKTRLGDMLSEPQHTASIRTLLYDKSEGHFLWASLALDRLQLDYENSVPLENFRDFIQDMPTPERLEEAYAYSCLHMSEEEKKKGTIMAQWMKAAGTQRTVTSRELGVAMEFLLTDETSFEKAHRSSNAVTTDLDQLRRFITQNSGGMLHVVTQSDHDIVADRHDTVRSFFDSTKGFEILGFTTSDEFKIAAEDLVVRCLQRFASMEEFKKSPGGVDGMASFCNEWDRFDSPMQVNRKQPHWAALAEYSALYAFEHVQKSTYFSRHSKAANTEVNSQMQDLIMA
jgi:hypothetical protein